MVGVVHFGGDSTRLGEENLLRLGDFSEFTAHGGFDRPD